MSYPCPASPSAVGSSTLVFVVAAPSAMPASLRPAVPLAGVCAAFKADSAPRLLRPDTCGFDSRLCVCVLNHAGRPKARTPLLRPGFCIWIRRFQKFKTKVNGASYGGGAFAGKCVVRRPGAGLQQAGAISDGSSQQEDRTASVQGRHALSGRRLLPILRVAVRVGGNCSELN
jgi:hypothetical protein